MEELGVAALNIFNSRDPPFVAHIMGATGGPGIDVVLNNLLGHLHESRRCISMFGRFVEVGKRELIDAGRLGLRTF